MYVFRHTSFSVMKTCVVEGNVAVRSRPSARLFGPRWDRDCFVGRERREGVAFCSIAAFASFLGKREN